MNVACLQKIFALIVEKNPDIRINCGIFGFHNFTINEKSL